MRFKEFISKHQIPIEILNFTQNKKVRAVNKAHRSGDLVYNINNELDNDKCPICGNKS